MGVYGATGAVLNKKAILCGGTIVASSSYSNACHVVGTNIKGTMKEKRSYAASLVYQGFWLLVTGGYNLEG